MDSMSSDCKPDGFSAILPTPFGALGVRVAKAALCGIRFLPPGTAAQAATDSLSAETCAQLTAYLDDPGFRFDLPLSAPGTEFQRRVWRAISAIAAGDVRRYGDLSTELGSAARAVGAACGANPLPVVVPCHRVVAANGIGGFAHATDGYLLDTKLWLLRHEGAVLA